MGNAGCAGQPQGITDYFAPAWEAGHQDRQSPHRLAAEALTDAALAWCRPAPPARVLPLSPCAAASR